jgi:hypothetical protein
LEAVAGPERKGQTETQPKKKGRQEKDEDEEEPSVLGGKGKFHGIF